MEFRCWFFHFDHTVKNFKSICFIFIISIGALWYGILVYLLFSIYCTHWAETCLHRFYLLFLIGFFTFLDQQRVYERDIIFLLEIKVLLFLISLCFVLGLLFFINWLAWQEVFFMLLFFYHWAIYLLLRLII